MPRTVAPGTSLPYSSYATATASNAEKNNTLQFVQTPSILLTNSTQRSAERENIVLHRSHNNHANPFHPSYRSTTSTQISFNEKSGSTFDSNTKSNANTNCKVFADYTRHPVFDKSHIDKTFSVIDTSSIKSGFEVNNDSLAAGLSSSLSCTSAQTGQMLQPSQFPPPYRRGVRFA